MAALAYVQIESFTECWNWELYYVKCFKKSLVILKIGDIDITRNDALAIGEENSIKVRQIGEWSWGG